LCGARVQEYAQAAPLVGRSSGLFSAAVKWRQQLLSRLLLLQVINLGFFSFLRPFFYWSIVAALLPLLLLLSHYLYMARCTERKGFNEWENLQFRGFCVRKINAFPPSIDGVSRSFIDQPLSCLGLFALKTSSISQGLHCPAYKFGLSITYVT
jgi:hypothetical protein